MQFYLTSTFASGFLLSLGFAMLRSQACCINAEGGPCGWYASLKNHFLDKSLLVVSDVAGGVHVLLVVNAFSNIGFSVADE